MKASVNNNNKHTQKTTALFVVVVFPTVQGKPIVRVN